MNGVNPRRARVGNHDAGGAENRDPADNSQSRIPGLPSQPLTVGDRDFDDHVGPDPRRGRHLLDHCKHHPSRYRVDGGFADRYGQPRQCHGSDARSGLENHSLSGTGTSDPRADQRLVRHVGIVAGILDDARKRRIRIQPFGGEGKGGLLPLRQRDAHRIGKLARQQGAERRLGRGGRACAGGPAATQGNVRFAGHGGL